MLTKRNKILIAVGGILIGTTAIIIFCIEKHENRDKINRKPRLDASLSPDGMVERPVDPKHPCSKKYSQADWEPEINFCYNTTKVIKRIIIPARTFQTKYRKDNPTRWIGYDFYLDAAPYNTRDSWWGDTFHITGNWPTNTYGWTKTAKQWKKIITNLTVSGTHVQMAINSTSMPLNKKNCSRIRLCAWATGTDPCWELRLCPLFIKNSSIAGNTTKGDLYAVGDKTRTKNVIITDRDIEEVDDWFKITTGISKIDNNWLLMAEQAAKVARADCVVCMGARPLLRVVPSALTADCLVDVMNKTKPSANCTSWETVYPLTKDEKQKPMFSSKVAPGNFSCISRVGTGPKLGKLKDTQCQTIVTVDVYFRSKARSDIWWWCGEDKLYDRLPYNTTGLCASVTLIMPVSIISLSVNELLTSINSILPHTWNNQRNRRSLGWSKDDPTYIDSVGVPRGVPDEYKLVNQVAAGFESSLCWWCTINKNVDRINYIHYNVQRLGNKTEEGFSATHEQLSATSLMAFQNRIAVDMLLAETGGVCSIFGAQCCTFVPNNTAADGSFTKALEGLRSLNNKMKDHSGVDTSAWDVFGEMFGNYKALVTSVLLSIAVFAAILTLCGCCCIPCIRALINKTITRAIEPVQDQLYALLPTDDVSDGGNEDEEDDDEDSLHLPDLYLDQFDNDYDLDTHV